MNAEHPLKETSALAALQPLPCGITALLRRIELGFSARRTGARARLRSIPNIST